MTAKVVGLTRYREKGKSGEALSEVRLLEGMGMDGNMHQGGERQLSLLSAEARAWMDSQTEKGLCFGRFKENILISGLPFNSLTGGEGLSVGEAVLRIRVRSKHCYGECGLMSRKMDCRLPTDAIFAVVERGGNVRTGDSVYLL